MNSYWKGKPWFQVRLGLAETSLEHRFPGEMFLMIKAPGASVEKDFTGSASAPRLGHVGTCGMDSGARPRLAALA